MINSSHFASWEKRYSIMLLLMGMARNMEKREKVAAWLLVDSFYLILHSTPLLSLAHSQQQQHLVVYFLKR